jgi:nucleoside-diphosphate-sugar epimerase
MSKYLITGIAGFIGSSLTDELLQRGEQVRGIDNFVTGKRANIKAFRNSIDLREIDLCDADAVSEACKGIDYVLHHGAIASVPRSIEDPQFSHASNVNGTLNMLQAARKHGVKRFIFAASSSAYGDQPGQPRVESMRPAPISPYAVQKLTGEYYLQSYYSVYGLETVALRYFNIFGPKQDPASPYSGVLARFILQMLEGETPTIFGDGEQARDFTYVANVVSANLLACAAPTENVAGRVFNIGCGRQFTLNRTYQVLSEMIGFKQPVLYGAPRTGDIRESVADISAAREAMGYTPRIGYEEGLAITVEWYRKTFRQESPF